MRWMGRWRGCLGSSRPVQIRAYSRKTPALINSNRSVPGLNNVLCFSPALIATPDDIDQITDAVDGALGRVFG